MNFSGIYVEDNVFYGDMNKIKNTFRKNTAVSGRVIYNNFEDFTEDIEISLKFKNSIPNDFVVGLGYYQTPFTTKGEYYKHDSTLAIYYSTNSQDNVEFSLSKSFDVNTVFKIVTENLNHITWYLNDSVVAYRDTKSSIPLRLRLDDFNNTMNLDYLKIKKL